MKAVVVMLAVAGKHVQEWCVYTAVELRSHGIP